MLLLHFVPIGLHLNGVLRGTRKWKSAEVIMDIRYGCISCSRWGECSLDQVSWETQKKKCSIKNIFIYSTFAGKETPTSIERGSRIFIFVLGIQIAISLVMESSVNIWVLAKNSSSLEVITKAASHSVGDMLPILLWSATKNWLMVFSQGFLKSWGCVNQSRLSIRWIGLANKGIQSQGLVMLRTIGIDWLKSDYRAIMNIGQDQNCNIGCGWKVKTNSNLQKSSNGVILEFKWSNFHLY